MLLVESAQRDRRWSRSFILLLASDDILLHILYRQGRACIGFSLSSPTIHTQLEIPGQRWWKRIIADPWLKLQLTALQQVCIGLLPQKAAQALAHARWQLLAIAAATHGKILVLGVLDVVCVSEGHSALFNPMDPEVSTEPA